MKFKLNQLSVNAWPVRDVIAMISDGVTSSDFSFELVQEIRENRIWVSTHNEQYLVVDTLHGVLVASGDSWLVQEQGQFYFFFDKDFKNTFKELPENTAAPHPAIADILKYFAYDHLPDHLQAVSKPLGDIANEFASTPGLKGPEVTVGLRKLLEAKDCFVRAALLTV